MSYTYINEDEIDIELKCMICYQPFQSPVNCINCGQTFCQECIDNWCKQQQPSCPTCRENGYLFIPVVTRIVLNQLNRLLVQCSLCQQKNIERNYFLDHINYVCPKQMISCKNKCHWKGLREDFEEHFIKCQTNKLSCFYWRKFFNCFN